jgi:tetratricopeptide (TPR) repeat protein
MNLVGAYRVERLEPPPELGDRIAQLIGSEPMSAFATSVLRIHSDCLNTGCSYMAADLAGWLEAYIKSGQSTVDHSYLQFLLGVAYREQGRMQDALNAFEQAHNIDPGYLHPLFEQANIFMALGQWDNAAFNLERIREANRTAPVRQDKALAELEAAIAKGRGGN